MDYKRLGSNIAYYRNKMNITQEKLAELAQVSTVFISQIETGIRKPSLKTIYNISCALNISIDSLINRNDLEKGLDHYTAIQSMLESKTDEEIQLIEEVCRTICLHTKENRIIGL